MICEMLYCSLISGQRINVVSEKYFGRHLLPQTKHVIKDEKILLFFVKCEYNILARYLLINI